MATLSPRELLDRTPQQTEMARVVWLAQKTASALFEFRNGDARSTAALSALLKAWSLNTAEAFFKEQLDVAAAPEDIRKCAEIWLDDLKDAPLPD